MARPTVWISSSSNEVKTGDAHPGEHWELVGDIDVSAQADFYTHIQIYTTARQRTKGKPEFYLSGDPESPWVERVKENPAAEDPFWILINPHGTAPIQYLGGSIKYLLGANKASAARSIEKREPETHPGFRVKPVMVAIRLDGRGGQVFMPLHTPNPS